MRRFNGLIWAGLLLGGGGGSACSNLVPSAPADAGEPTSFFVETGAEEKTLLYNLVGRWYPEDEIKRLSDRTLSATEWCQREPAIVSLTPEKLEVRCAKGASEEATISKVSREEDGTIVVGIRAKANSKLKPLRILAKGPKATISGSPCFEGPVQYGRFPEYEILSREILQNRRCAQLPTEEPVPAPDAEPRADPRVDPAED